MDKKRDRNSLISIVVPIHNESEKIHILFDAICEVIIGYTWEILFIDDGSTDDTLSVLRELSEKYDFVRYISLSRKLGRQIALKAGFDNALGDCLISLNADMPHPPEVIPALLKQWHEGFDAVHTICKNSEDTTFFKRVSSNILHRILTLLSGQSILSDSADFRLLDRSMINICKEMHVSPDVFWRTLIPWMGGCQCNIHYTASSRHHGVSKYNFLRILILTWNSIRSYSLFPFRCSLLFGGGAIVLASVYLIFSLVINFAQLTVPGWTSLIGAIIFLSGVQLLCFGVLGEYLKKNQMVIKRHPDYIIKEKKHRKALQLDEG